MTAHTPDRSSPAPASPDTAETAAGTSDPPAPTALTSGMTPNPSRETVGTTTEAVRTVAETSLGGVTGTDEVAVEEPLTIRLATLAGATRDLAVTMRTPGHDAELAVGWLSAEGIIGARRDILDVAPCAVGADEDAQGNAIQVTLARDQLPDTSALDRHGLITSACGVCGRHSLEALASTGVRPVPDTVRVAATMVAELPGLLRAAQPTFAITGGVHAAGLVTVTGELVAIREDVGRHNAMDKLVGAALLDNDSLDGLLLVLSGRASYELLAKAAAAQLEVVVANGAASSLAVDVAMEFGITLLSFAVGPTPRIVANPHRIVSRGRPTT